MAAALNATGALLSPFTPAETLNAAGVNISMYAVGHATFDGCKTKCAALGGASLPCIRNADDFAAFRAASKDLLPVWFGFYQSPSDKGTSVGWQQQMGGAPLNWAAEWCESGTWAIPWYEGEPNDYNTVEGCAGMLSQGAAYDLPCSWDGPTCVCQASPDGTDAALAAASATFVEEQERETSSSQWTDFYVRLGIFILAISVVLTFWCCVLNTGCCWAKHVRSVGPFHGQQELRNPRSCCFTHDHVAAREGEYNSRCARVRTEAFDCLRGFAALQVSIGHYFSYWAGSGYDHPHELGGGNAVLMFFLMSGFVMQVGYAGKGPADGSCACCTCCCPRGICCLGCGGSFAKSFWARRLARLAPVAWLAIALHLPLTFIEQKSRVGTLPIWGQTAFLIEEGVATGLFVQTFVGMGVNGPLWTLCSQWFFYLLFPALTDWCHTRKTTFTLICTVVFFWLLYVGLWVGTAGGDVFGMYIIAHVHPVNKLPLFLIGMVMASHALLHAAKPPPELSAHKTFWGGIATAITLFLAVYTAIQVFMFAIVEGSKAGQLDMLSRVVGELALPAVYITWMYSLTQSPDGLSARVFCWAPFRFLGKISFCVYCLHFPLLAYYAWARAAMEGRNYWKTPRKQQPYDLLGAFALILGCSTLTYYAVEEPCRRWLQRCLASPNRVSAAAPSPSRAGRQSISGGDLLSSDSAAVTTRELELQWTRSNMDAAGDAAPARAISSDDPLSNESNGNREPSI